MYQDLKEIQREDTTNQQLRMIVNDIRKFLRGDEKSLETN